MNWETVLSFVRPELLILIVFLWALGLFLKKAPWFRNEWAIPFISLGIGVVFAILYIAVVIGEGFTASVIISAIIQGTIIAALAVFGYEGLKQLLYKRPVDKMAYDDEPLSKKWV